MTRLVPSKNNRGKVYMHLAMTLLAASITQQVACQLDAAWQSRHHHLHQP